MNRGKRFGKHADKIEADNKNWKTEHVEKKKAEREADEKDFVLNGLKDKSNAEKGFWGEVNADRKFREKGYTHVGDGVKMDKIKDKAEFDAKIKQWEGRNGIDAIYKDKNGNFVIVESKATGSIAATKKWEENAPKGTKGGLADTKNTGRQLSDEWITNHVNADTTLSKADKAKILDGLSNGSTKRVLARTSENGTTFHQVNKNDARDVDVGDVFNFD